FVDHEWTKHGSCAGADTAQSFFQEVCNMAQEPLQVMQKQLQKSKNLNDVVDSLKRSNFSVYETDHENAQVLLSACAGVD
ncbi:unnamed protein product, partial [Symbiodinium pilosum]